MQLIKRSPKNQVVIPKTILEEAGVGPQDSYLKVDYNKRLGAILLRPVLIEERIPTAALERFEAKVVKGQQGDKRFSSMGDALRHVRSSRKSCR